MRIAIIGSGISGLTAAYLLSEAHDVVVFEANNYIGGHTHTVDVTIKDRPYAVDTGFIIFNDRTYPNFIKLLRRLGVQGQKSQMSFSVTCEKTGLEFNPGSLNTLFVQRRNLLRPFFYQMLFDTLRFRRDSEELLASDDDVITLDGFLSAKGYSRAFKQYFIKPMGEAIWSADPEKFNDFPARYFVRFFKNHGMLNLRNRPQWFTIKGRSRQYIKPITKSYAHNIRLNCPVVSIRRHADRVEIKTKGEPVETFDQVIIATHSDQALAMLADPTVAETQILGAIPYQENRTVLHWDETLLPANKAAWASWNYRVAEAKRNRVAVTYNMNILQRIGAPNTLCVSLNLGNAIDPQKIYRRLTYHHPVYDPKGMAARARYREISGANRTHYAGAYWRYGFHEDGVVSALWVCEKFGIFL